MRTTSSSSIRVFVYGSLKRGFHNHHFLRRQRFLGEARTQPVYRLLSLGAFPGMVRADDDGRSIRGEVWEVDARCKLRIDGLEGVDHGHYRCVRARLLPPFNGSPVLTYLLGLDPKGMPDAGEHWTLPSRHGGNLT